MFFFQPSRHYTEMLRELVDAGADVNNAKNAGAVWVITVILNKMIPCVRSSNDSGTPGDIARSDCMYWLNTAHSSSNTCH